MDKKLFYKKEYFLLFRVIFWCAFIFFIILGIWGIFYEDDMPMAGFFWAVVVVIAYWFIKRIWSRKV